MEEYLKNNFDVEAKRPSEEALKRWRSAVWLVKNPRRRFRMVADLAKRAEVNRKRKMIQEKIRIALYVQKAALHFIDAVNRPERGKIPEEVTEAGFNIDPDDLASIASKHDIKLLESHGGLEGLSKKLSVSLENGISVSEISDRQKIYGVNKFLEKPARPFWMFVWDALQDLTLIILMICAVISVGVGIATEGWPKGLYDGIGISTCIFLVVIVTAISDYKQSLQFRDLDKEKRNIFVYVTRNGSRKKVSIYDLVAGDIVYLSIGDQVPADGIFISGYSLSVDESSLSGESEPVNVDKNWPFLLSGTKVQDGSGKMLVTSVGMRTEWGRLMVTLSEGGEDETPLQVKLNGVATVIGKIGLAFSVLTFFVLTSRFLVEKAMHGHFMKWSISDAVNILNFFAIAVTILVVAVPEGLPLAVTLSLAFAMKKLMNDKALVRHLSACETMGSASCICTDKTGTLTTNHMVVTRIWICGEVRRVDGNGLKSVASENVTKTLVNALFLNTGAEVVKGKDGKNEILGSPTETALLEFGLLFEKDFDARKQEFKILKVQPFNSVKKKMSVLVGNPGGGCQAFLKGASEIVLEKCDQIVGKKGESVPLSQEQKKDITSVINGFASEALRTLCIAFKDVEESYDESILDDNYTLLAVIGIKDPVRPGVKEAVKTCLNAGIVVRMVTGDNIHTAKAIARECGILTDDGIAIEGPDFREKSNQEMQEIIPKLQVMARSLPLDKHKLVTLLRKEFNEVVAVTGDGTNDAPALHEADIGLAMGIAGTEVAKESADVVIMDDNFTTILNVAKWGRAVYINIQKFIQFQLTVNVVALVTNFASACITGSAPLTAVQLLWVNMIMDTLGALALATEPPHDGLMMRPPVGRNVNLITKTMWRNIIGQSFYQLAVLGVLLLDGKRIFNLNDKDSDATLNTLVFNTFVFCQGTFTDTTPLGRDLWIVSIGLGAGSLLVAIVLKCIPVSRLKSRGIVMHHHDGYEPLPTGPDRA
ncbi:calcium-transporting ATPase 11, plasma membrane-type [Dorcoceras hygrometricum]|uniref:Calcium-transporting ATPase n=1 Tax=Dorcoceras hygrometricum TaxID=472368 RepID=A0A2Z7CJL0_9LAMI|nr:calcium-transporting ATPase 11, plasma membrane-type [Dorcoceras hygrometricum]